MLLTKKLAIQDQYLETAIQAVSEAEKVILKYFEQNLDIELKENNSPVTLADKESEKIIKKIISSKFPEHNFLGEEEGEDNSGNSKSEYTWVIDPIDGTKAFIRGLPHFGVLIALQKNKETILGLSYLPIFKDLLYAVKNQGCYLNHEQVKISETSSLSETYLSISAFHKIEKLSKNQNGLTSLCESVRYQRALGDAYHFNFLAQGKLDIILEAGGKIWDWAVFKLAIEEAGGIVTQLNGKPFTNKSTNILATNKFLHKQVVEYFKHD